MCGIAGRILRGPGPIGRDLVTLMQAQRHRGADSTGFALYGPPRAEGFVLRVALDDRRRLDATLEGVRERIRLHGADLVEDPTWDETGQRHVLLRVVVSEPTTPVARWVEDLDGLEGVEVISVGRSLEIVKDLGDAAAVGEKHGLAEFVGTHGLGHARLATESAVYPLASHPFWARPFPDVAIVHNGQLTNYFLSRRRLQRQGYRFTTENDSELIAVWISDRMSRGRGLAEALGESVRELDGVFTFLLSTEDAIGLAKDRLAIKPIAAIEEDGEAAMATEEQALRKLYPTEGEVVNYDGPGMVRVWNVPRHAEVT